MRQTDQIPWIINKSFTVDTKWKIKLGFEYCVVPQTSCNHLFWESWDIKLTKLISINWCQFSFFSWVFGEFLCKMYQFVHSLSYTASIFILMIICMERYFAIIFPITCKQILTSTRLRVSWFFFFYFFEKVESRPISTIRNYANRWKKIIIKVSQL